MCKMERFEEQAKRILLYAGVCCAVLFGVYIAFRYLLKPLLPFVLALVLAFAVVPASEKIAAKSRLSCRFWAIVLLAVLSALLFVFLWTAASMLFSELSSVASDGEDLFAAAEGMYRSAIAALRGRFPVLASRIDEGMFDEKVGELLSRASVSASVYLAKIAFSLPEALLFAVVTLLAAYYFSLDGRRVLAFFYAAFPERMRRTARKFVLAVRAGVGGYLKAGGYMMIITYLELQVGFLLLGVRFPLLMALIVAAVDFLPVLGTGTVLVPMALFQFLLGNSLKGFGFLALWGLTALVRQFVEPRILGKNLGIHPLFSLLSGYAGLTLFGIPGMILLPIAASVGYSVFCAFEREEAV